MLVINTKLVDKLIELGTLTINNPGKSIIFIIILLLIAFIMCIVIYRKSKWTQVCINALGSMFFPIIKKERVIMATFSKNQAVMKNVLDEYSLIGYKKFNLNYLKKFTDESKFTEKVLQEVIDKQYKKINRIKKGIKNTDSFVYLGFPHVPIAILDGKNFSGTDNVILYEYKGALSNSSDKGFFELKKVYNSEMELSSNYKEKVLVGKALALKIEQSFPVGDDKIKELLGDIPIVYLKNNDVKRWGVESYSDVDKFAKEFYKILQWASEKGIDKIHIFATTPVSLTFSLGRVIEHYHPEIIAYNYNNNKYDWYINCTNKKVKKI